VFEFHRSASAPQFLTAEYLGVIPPDHCQLCGKLIHGSYFRVSSQMACPACAEMAGFHAPQENSGPSYVRTAAVVLACMLGSVVLAALTHWTIPTLAIAVGYAVGRSMKSSGGEDHSGRSVFAAVTFTYLIVAVGMLPTILSRNLVPSITNLTGGERIAALGLITLISPLVQLVQSEDGVFVVIALAAGVLFAAKQVAASKPQLIVGPFTNSPSTS
jgi:hypothetical protein